MWYFCVKTNVNIMWNDKKREKIYKKCLKKREKMYKKCLQKREKYWHNRKGVVKLSYGGTYEEKNLWKIN